MASAVSSIGRAAGLQQQIGRRAPKKPSVGESGSQRPPTQPSAQTVSRASFAAKAAAASRAEAGRAQQRHEQASIWLPPAESVSSASSRRSRR
jgi:hypothetical protein